MWSKHNSNLRHWEVKPSKGCGRVLEKNFRSCIIKGCLVLQEFSLWYITHPEHFSIYESWGVFWIEPDMSVLTVLEELQAPKSWWVPLSWLCITVTAACIQVWCHRMGIAKGRPQQPHGSLQSGCSVVPQKFRTVPAVDFFVNQQFPCLLSYFLARVV